MGESFVENWGSLALTSPTPSPLPAHTVTDVITSEYVFIGMALVGVICLASLTINIIIKIIRKGF